MAASGESRYLGSAVERALKSAPATETEIVERIARSGRRLCLDVGGLRVATRAQVKRDRGVGSASVAEKLGKPVLDFAKMRFAV